MIYLLALLLLAPFAVYVGLVVLFFLDGRSATPIHPEVNR